MSLIANLTGYLQTQLEDSYGGSTLYAIVDSAIYPKFTEALYLLDEERYRILLKAPLAEMVEEAAPYLIALDLDEEYTQALIKEGFGSHWLTYLWSHKEIESLQIELQEMIMPYSELHEKEILFRFYDPRNLQNYLLIHDEDELAEMFDDVGGTFMVVDTEFNTMLNLYSSDDISDFVDLEAL